MTLADYRKWAEGRIAYLSYALRGLPEDRIRFHTCYGVNFGPRVSDLQLAPAARARVAGAGAHQAARRKAPDPRRSHALQCDDRAPRDDCRPHRALGPCRRP